MAAGVVAWVRRLFGGESAEDPLPAHETRSQRQYRYVVRDGQSEPADRVFDAWTSGDFPSMLAVLNTPTNPIDRHHLLCLVVDETYRRRSAHTYAALCRQTAETYLSEFETAFPVLKRAWKDNPMSISVFQKYALLLVESKQFDRAIEVCNIAIKHDLRDGTKSGYPGRIKRIEAARARLQAPK